MAYYYVKNGGTATGDAGRYASQQTGSFASLGVAGYYNNIESAIAATTTPISGDFIGVSDAHSFTQATAYTYQGALVNPFFIVCVDDLNIDAGRGASRGGEICTSTSNDINVNDQFISGIKLGSSDNINFNNNCTLYDCELSVSGSADIAISATTGEDSVRMIGGVINLASSGSVAALIQGGASLSLNAVTLTSGVSVTTFSEGGFINGGGEMNVSGCDLSVVTGTILSAVGAADVDDSINVKFDMCKIAAGVAFTDEVFKSRNQRALFTRCSDSSAAAEYQYHLHAFGGDVDDDSAIYRNEDEAFTESNQKISYKIVTNADAALGAPLWFDFPVLRYSKLSAAATDTLRFYLTSNTALTDKDIYVEVSYPDGTNKQTPNFISSAPQTVGGSLDLMAAGATLTTDATSTWTGGLTNKYQIDVSTAGDVGADCQPIVKIYVTKPSITIQLASEYGLV